jgi:hypothetical protein
MGCNFNIAATISIMVQHDTDILAIQEHTPWNRELFQVEIASIEKTCKRWRFSIIFSKLQLLIIDKQ